VLSTVSREHLLPLLSVRILAIDGMEIPFLNVEGLGHLAASDVTI